MRTRIARRQEECRGRTGGRREGGGEERRWKGRTALCNLCKGQDSKTRGRKKGEGKERKRGRRKKAKRRSEGVQEWRVGAGGVVRAGQWKGRG